MSVEPPNLSPWRPAVFFPGLNCRGNVVRPGGRERFKTITRSGKKKRGANLEGGLIKSGANWRVCPSINTAGFAFMASFRNVPRFFRQTISLSSRQREVHNFAENEHELLNVSKLQTILLLVALCFFLFFSKSYGLIFHYTKRKRLKLININTKTLKDVRYYRIKKRKIRGE